MIFINSNSVYQIPSKLTSLMNPCLESTDAAPEVPHPRLTRLPACQTASAFFFFSDSRQLGSIRADAARFVPNRLRFAPNRADSAKIGPYRPYQVVSAGGRYSRDRLENGRNMPKSALNMAGKSETCILLSFFFESRHSMCFLKIF